MKRILFPIFLTMALAVLGVIPAGAQSQFTLATADVNQSGFLIASYKEIGLSPGAQVAYTLSASAKATYACLPNGYSVNRHKMGQYTQETVGGTISGQTPAKTASKKGVISGGIALPPPGPPDTLTCSAGDTVHLVKVSYWGVSLTSSASGSADLVGNCAEDSGCTDVLLPGK